jgi:hypothetical protein
MEDALDGVPAFIELLRGADEHDIFAALDGAYIELPIKTPVEALEPFNCVLDILTGERDRAHALDAARIAHAARKKS